MTSAGAPSQQPRHLVFVVPGRLDTCTGGYGYDRRIHGSTYVDGDALTDLHEITVSFTDPTDPNSRPCECPDDGNACTDDYCEDGQCVHPPNVATCDDGDACTVGDVCGGGVCGGTYDEGACEAANLTTALVTYPLVGAGNLYQWQERALDNTFQHTILSAFAFPISR